MSAAAAAAAPFPATAFSSSPSSSLSASSAAVGARHATGAAPSAPSSFSLNWYWMRGSAMSFGSETNCERRVVG
jgi:hypothetical protein